MSQSKPNKTIAHRLFRLPRQIALMRTLHRLAKAGLKKRDIAEQLALYGSKTHKQIGLETLDTLDKGEPFSTGLKPWIDTLAWEALLAGERSGDWTKGLANALIALDTRSISMLVLVGALAKPIAGIVALLGISAIASTQFFPMMEEMVPRNQWSDITLMAVEFGEFWVQWGLQIALISTTIITMMSMSLPLLTGRLRQLIDNMPIYRQYRLTQVSMLLRSMGNLTLAGVDLLDTLQNMARNANPYLRHHISKMIEHVHQGNVNLGAIMNTGLLNQAEQHSLQLLGEIGEHPETLLSSADIHHEILLDDINFVKEYAPVILKIIGLNIVLLMGGGMLLLMTELAQNIRF